MSSPSSTGHALAYQPESTDYPYTMQKSESDNYIAHRPAYPSSMFTTWLEYHKANGSQTDTAQDIGSGPGVCAKGLGDYFSHVFVSDPGKGNLAAARQRLMPTEKFTFCQQPGEIPWLRDSSIDLSAICIALHFMDAEIVLRNVARALRPGGTLAIVSYGTAINFLDEPRLNMLSAHVMHSGIKERVDGHAGAVEMMAIRRYMAGLDSTAIPGDLFTNVLRLQINMRESVTTSFRMVPEGVLDALESEIKVGETVRYIDDDGWHDETDVAWLKGYLKSIVEFEDEAWDSAEWQEIERVITEELGGKVHIEWPVSMILALKSIATPGNS